MTEPYLAAAVQMQSGEDKSTNLATALRLVEQAAAGGAQLVALPEMFNCLGRYEVVAAEAEILPGPTSDAMADLAARLHVTLLAGSIAERDSAAPGAAIYNTSLLFDPDGRLLARYRKVHRFDVDLPGKVVVRESRWFAAGRDVAPVTTALGTLGVAICYDLRFPELFRRLSSAAVQVMIVPSAFTLHTGRDHWEVLLRARAIENQAYVIAPNQCGRHSPQLTSYGHSAIVDPWGRLLACAPESGEAIVSSVIDLEQLTAIRKQLPALAHRRDR
jgi:deaminated glutathione amidase